MKHGRALVESLKQFVAGKETLSELPRPERTLDYESPELRFHLTARDADKFSFILDELAFDFAKETADERVEPQTLKRLAKELASRATYLVEGLDVIEVDDANLTVQVRSKPPHTEAHRVEYFELLLTASGQGSFKRYVFDKSSRKRATIPFHVTEDVLARFAEDIYTVFA
ncbi:MAG: hypothetical protein D6743_01105 [Calditrichaeota bacterium]|nr:MAG: hypothetical protein D6743_01105 [Calditrichota bacterium]